MKRYNWTPDFELPQCDCPVYYCVNQIDDDQVGWGGFDEKVYEYLCQFSADDIREIIKSGESLVVECLVPEVLNRKHCLFLGRLLEDLDDTYRRDQSDSEFDMTRLLELQELVADELMNSYPVGNLVPVYSVSVNVRDWLNNNPDDRDSLSEDSAEPLVALETEEVIYD